MEDILFKEELKKLNIVRTKDMYRKATRPIQCLMCGKKSKDIGYVLKEEYVYGYETPYWSICKDCYEELD